MPSATAGTTEKGKSGAVSRGLRASGGMQGERMGIGVKALMGLGVHGWNIEEMKFRLAFLVGPALIGLSMAV